MSDKIRTLVESEAGRVPPQLKPFIQRNEQGNPDNKIFMKLSYMADAYGNAFTQLAEGVLDDWPKKNYIVQPMVYLARHSIELNLKWIISEYQQFLGDYSEKTDHHNLAKLWNALIKLLSAAGAPADNDYSKYCLKLLNHINQTDPDGEQFRYPHNKDGKPFDLAKIDLEELVKAHWHVSQLAEAYVDMIPDLAEEVTDMELNVRGILSGQAPSDTPVTVKGWVRTRRDSKAGISFVHLSDGSAFHPVQVVAPNTLPNYNDEILKLTSGCAIEATGTIVPSPAKGQPFEMQASAIKVIGWVDDPDTYPIQPKPHTMEFLREVAHLRPRTNVIGAATRVRHTLAQAIHRFFDERGFVWVNTPIITSSDAEGAGQLFRVSTLDLANLPRTPDGKVDFAKDFFGSEAFLTVSGQLNVEAYCLALTKVYTFGPTFRAENSNTSRHLAEFWMIEPEIAFADLSDDATLAEQLLKYCLETLLKERADDLAFFDERVEKGLLAKLNGIVGSEFVRMDYSEAVSILERAKEKFEFPVKWGIDLQSEHERYLTEKHAKKPVIVMNYPKGIKAFYMRLNDDDKTVAAMDVLAPGIGEIIGGSQREERLDVLDARMVECGIDREHYAWYRDLRRYGTVPHAGFGLGFERTLSYVTGISNVRDAIPYPRTPGHAKY